MAKSSKNDTNFQKYLNNLKHRGYANLPIPTHEESIAELIAEGDRLLIEDETKQKKSSSTTPTAASTPPKKVSAENPYVKARKQVLNEYGEKKAAMILKMEAEKDVDNCIYQCFYQRVTEIGDKLSNN